PQRPPLFPYTTLFRSAHRALAGVYYQEGQFEEALEEEMPTLEFGGITERISIFLGMVFDILGRPDRALTWNQIAEKLQSPPDEADRKSTRLNSSHLGI